MKVATLTLVIAIALAVSSWPPLCSAQSLRVRSLPTAEVHQEINIDLEVSKMRATVNWGQDVQPSDVDTPECTDGSSAGLADGTRTDIEEQSMRASDSESQPSDARAPACAGGNIIADEPDNGCTGWGSITVAQNKLHGADDNYDSVRFENRSDHQADIFENGTAMEVPPPPPLPQPHVQAGLAITESPSGFSALLASATMAYHELRPSATSIVKELLVRVFSALPKLFVPLVFAALMTVVVSLGQRAAAFCLRGNVEQGSNDLSPVGGTAATESKTEQTAHGAAEDSDSMPDNDGNFEQEANDLSPVEGTAATESTSGQNAHEAAEGRDSTPGAQPNDDSPVGETAATESTNGQTAHEAAEGRDSTPGAQPNDDSPVGETAGTESTNGQTAHEAAEGRDSTPGAQPNDDSPAGETAGTESTNGQTAHRAAEDLDRAPGTQLRRDCNAPLNVVGEQDSGTTRNTGMPSSVVDAQATSDNVPPSNAKLPHSRQKLESGRDSGPHVDTATGYTNGHDDGDTAYLAQSDNDERMNRDDDPFADADYDSIHDADSSRPEPGSTLNTTHTVQEHDTELIGQGHDHVAGAGLVSGNNAHAANSSRPRSGPAPTTPRIVRGGSPECLEQVYHPRASADFVSSHHADAATSSRPPLDSAHGPSSARRTILATPTSRHKSSRPEQGVRDARTPKSSTAVSIPTTKGVSQTRSQRSGNVTCHECKNAQLVRPVLLVAFALLPWKSVFASLSADSYTTTFFCRSNRRRCGRRQMGAIS